MKPDLSGIEAPRGMDASRGEASRREGCVAVHDSLGALCMPRAAPTSRICASGESGESERAREKERSLETKRA